MFGKKAEETLKDFEEIIKEELNIKDVEVIADESNLNDEYLMVNFKVAGGLLKEKIQIFKNKLETIDDVGMQELVNEFNNEKVKQLKIEGFGEIEKEAFVKNTRPKSNIVVIKEDGYTVALDTTLTEELIVEGMARDLVRTLQVLRKDAGLRVEQRISLSILSKGKLMQKVLKEHINKITEDTLTKDFSVEKIENPILEKEIDINDEAVTIQISPVE